MNSPLSNRIIRNILNGNHYDARKQLKQASKLVTLEDYAAANGFEK